MDTNATQAAIRAGYSPRSARSVGHEDLTGPDIRAAIDGAQSKQFEAAGVSASRTLQALTQIAFSDITAFFDDDGHLRPYGELTPAQRAQISTISRRRRKKEGGGTEVTYAIRREPTTEVTGKLPHTYQYGSQMTPEPSYFVISTLR